jgi:hypothetical protein
MTLPPPNVCRLIAQLHALIGSPAAKEAENAREKLVQLLTKHGCSWNDLPQILAAVGTNDPATTNDATSPQPEGTAADAMATHINIFDLIVRLIEKYVAVSDDERIAIALWVLHTWIFDQFPITPRLALLSPVRGCGKTLLLILIELLCAEPFRSDNVTAAVIYHHLRSRPRSPLLLDEGDNQNIFRDGPLRAVFNSGHRRGGNIAGLLAAGPGGSQRSLRSPSRQSARCRCRCCTVPWSSPCSDGPLTYKSSGSMKPILPGLLLSSVRWPGTGPRGAGSTAIRKCRRNSVTERRTIGGRCSPSLTLSDTAKMHERRQLRFARSARMKMQACWHSPASEPCSTRCHRRAGGWIASLAID